MTRSVSLFFNKLHAYIYGRWTKDYVHFVLNRIFPRLGQRGKRWWADRYHFKVLTKEHATSIINVKMNVLLRDLEQIIPFQIARDFVLKAPPDVVVYECACRMTRSDPCLPTQVCLVIGRPFVDFILKYHPRTSRRVSQREAVGIIEAEHARGHIQTAWFKDAMGNRFYAICNCCKCCCFGMEAISKHKVPMVASSGYVAQVNKDACQACSACAEACPFESIQVDGTADVGWDSCMGCGICVDRCPNEAMELVRDTRKGAPLDVRLLAADQAAK